jgi:phosphatidylglycerol:prolipoprotein diacylglycerol transferase
MGPLIPFIVIPPLHLLGPLDVDAAGFKFLVPELSIKPFGTLVAIGVYLGIEVVRRQGVRLKLDGKALSSFVAYVLVGGFIGGHVLDTIFYHPEQIAKDPVSLLRIWAGQSSFGGFTGAVMGLFYWRYKFKKPTLVYGDVVGSALPLGWMFGRMGCSVAHDHPGMLSNAWFAVAYPHGGRFDLGLYEMLLTIPIAATFLFLMRKPRPAPFFLGTMCLAYAPMRFALDFLRATDVAEPDPRYGSLTPAQWGCMLVLAGGVYLTLRAARSAETAPPPEPALPVDPAPPADAARPAAS